jgi:hypothetical protein
MITGGILSIANAALFWYCEYTREGQYTILVYGPRHYWTVKWAILFLVVGLTIFFSLE